MYIFNLFGPNNASETTKTWKATFLCPFCVILVLTAHQNTSLHQWVQKLGTRRPLCTCGGRDHCFKAKLTVLFWHCKSDAWVKNIIKLVKYLTVTQCTLVTNVIKEHTFWKKKNRSQTCMLTWTQIKSRFNTIFSPFCWKQNTSLSQWTRAGAQKNCHPAARSSWDGRPWQAAPCSGSLRPRACAVSDRSRETLAICGASTCSRPQNSPPALGPTRPICCSANGRCACCVWEKGRLRPIKSRCSGNNRKDIAGGAGGGSLTWWMSAGEVWRCFQMCRRSCGRRTQTH